MVNSAADIITGGFHSLPLIGRRRAGGVLSMELVLILPLFLILIFSMLEFSFLMSAQTRVEDAARHGSQLLCVSGCREDIVREEVGRMLGRRLGKDAVVRIQPPPADGQVGNVRLSVPMTNASPDLLWMIGFSLRDRHLSADAPMIGEVAYDPGRITSAPVTRY